MYMGGAIAQLVSHLLSIWGPGVRIPVETWHGSPNAWMRGEEIASCKSHIASVNLTDQCIMIFFFKDMHMNGWICVLCLFFLLNMHQFTLKCFLNFTIFIVFHFKDLYSLVCFWHIKKWFVQVNCATILSLLYLLHCYYYLILFYF